MAHCFEDEISGSVILDIQESNISSFILYNSELILSKKNKHWPCFFNTLDELDKNLKKEGYRYFLITASYGFNGWILSKQYNVVDHGRMHQS